MEPLSAAQAMRPYNAHIQNKADNTINILHIEQSLINQSLNNTYTKPLKFIINDITIVSY